MTISLPSLSVFVRGLSILAIMIEFGWISCYSLIKTKFILFGKQTEVQMKTRTLLLTGLVAILLVVACSSKPVPTSTSQSASTGSVVEIRISGFAFDPNTITIKTGTEVKWTNLDSAQHTIVSDSGNEIGSPSLGNGESYSHVFTVEGTYAYHCGIHASMTGTIIVTK